MIALFQGKEFEVSARGVPASGGRTLPNYVRLECMVWPVQFHTIMTPADARFLAAELIAAADDAVIGS